MICITSFFVSSLFAAANALPGPPPRIVPGRMFDRFVDIWLENTNFADALADPNLSALAAKGVTLTNYWAVTHPSEPNYIASVGGDYFGMDNDNLNMVPGNVSTIVDLLEDRGVSWAEYQEDMPSSGFSGFQFLNQITGANDYVRKHNPLIIYESVQNNTRRASNIKNFTLFFEDVQRNTVPQWMFITPNMTNDGHDTNVTFAGAWAAGFLNPLLSNPNFNSKRTLIQLTFDETSNDAIGNRVFSILLGGAIPKSLIGTSDPTFYTHYSDAATVQANWDLHHLGRFDASANVFSMVAQHSGDRLRSPPDGLAAVFLNGSYPGLFNSITTAPLPIPNTELVVNGRTILPEVKRIWGSKALQKCTTYTDQLVPPSLADPPVLPAGC